MAEWNEIVGMILCFVSVTALYKYFTYREHQKNKNLHEENEAGYERQQKRRAAEAAQVPHPSVPAFRFHIFLPRARQWPPAAICICKPSY
jgi:hypothetical protein